MKKLFLILLLSCLTFYKIYSEIVWYYPPPVYPRIEYCQGMCFEIYDTIIGGWVRDTTRYYQHLLIFESNTHSDTVHVPMRNFRFTYCFPDTGHYSMDDAYNGFINGTLYCCSGVKYTDAMVIKGCAPIANYYNNKDTICKEEALILKDSSTRQANNWQWQFFGSTTEVYNDKSPPKIYYKESGTYPIQLIVSNAYGSDTLVKEITVEDCDDCIFVPDAFSPNNDGINDEFKIYPNCIIDNYNLKIYNRWESLVFETNDINSNWDGKYKNANCETDNYSYLISFKNHNSNQTINKKGYVLLLK